MKSEVIRSLRRSGVRPSKRFGQNFLIEPYVIDEICTFGGFTGKEHIVEIGPGTGALTEALYGAEKLTLIEIEPNFCESLRQRFPRAEIINADVRDVDFSKIGTNLVVFGNVPYSFSTDIIFHLIENRHSVDRAIVMLQKEFAERIAAEPGRKAFGVLSIFTQNWCEPDLGLVIPGTAFVPPTKVDSRLLSLQFAKEPQVAPELQDLFETIVKLAFLKRRKKIYNSLKASSLIEDEVLIASFAASGVDSSQRPEDLSIQEFERLVREIKARIPAVPPL